MPQIKRPISLEAVTALTVSFVAVSLAILGIYSPWGALRFPVSQKLTGYPAIFGYGGTCVLPIVLGLAAALLGGRSYRGIERAQGKIAGDGQAFFSIMIGLFAVIIGACTTFAALIWPSL